MRSRCRSCAYPRIAFIGVRISCDMFARKALFARLALSAASLAARSSVVRLVTSAFEVLVVLAQLEVRNQHLGERVEQRTLFEKKRPFGRRGTFLEVDHFDEPAAFARHDGRGLLPRRVAPTRG